MLKIQYKLSQISPKHAFPLINQLQVVAMLFFIQFSLIFSLLSYSCGKIQLFFYVDNNSMWNVSMTHLSNSLVYQFSLFFLLVLSIPRLSFNLPHRQLSLKFIFGISNSLSFQSLAFVLKNRLSARPEWWECVVEGNLINFTMKAFFSDDNPW